MSYINPSEAENTYVQLLLLLLLFFIVGQAKRGHVKRECEQRIADAVRLELGAPKVTASCRPALISSLEWYYYYY